MLTMGRLGSEMAKAALAVSPQGETSLRLSDANGKQRVLLVSSAEGPFLTLIDEDGEPKAWIRIDANGAAELKLRDELGLPAFEVPESSPKTETM